MQQDRMWVIVEGPDGAGKSTLSQTAAHALASDGGSRPKRACVLQKLSYDSAAEDYLVPVEYPLLHAVQDRGPTSGLVYEPLKRGDQDRLAWFRPLTRDAIAAGAAMVHVTASIGMLEQRLAHRGDDYIENGLLGDIVEGYEREVDRWKKMGGLAYTIDTTRSFPSATVIALALSTLRAGGEGYWE